MGLWYDGVYMFNGSTTTNVTEHQLGRDLFLDADLSTAYAEFDGEIYTLYYDTAGSGIDTCLNIDLSYYPQLICYFSDFVSAAHQYYIASGTHYLSYGGYEYSISGTETISTTLQTGDLIFSNPLQKKNLEYLYYDINTGGEDVTVDFYVDGTNSYTLTLNTSSRTKKRSDPLPTLEGYRFSLVISCSDSSGLTIYGPWGLSATEVGV